MRKTKRLLPALTLGCCLLPFAAVQASTVAHWTFDDGQAGAPMNPGNGGAVGTLDQSGNGYHLHAWDDYWGPSFSQESETPTSAGLSASFAGHQDAYTDSAGINTWAPAEWTIEAAVMLSDLSGWQTFIGKDTAAPGGGNGSAFYLQKTWDDLLRVDFVTAGGERYQATSSFAMEPNTWYRLAAVSDGSDLMLYVDHLNGKGYELAASTPMSGSLDNSMAGSNGNWTLGRGWWNGNFVDQITGKMDAVRFSDEALSPNNFLYPNNEVAPPTITPAPGYRWELVFEDDFEGGSLDGSKWRDSYPWGDGHTHNHDAFCIPEQISFDDGHLVITAEHAPDYDGTGHDYISGIINTHGRFHMTYGYIEASLQLPPGQGTWPAFWTLQDGWPPEIDIMEQLNDNAEFYTNYHWGPSWEEHYSSGQWIQRPNLMTQFNTYALEWTEDHLRWFFNNEAVRTFGDSAAIAESANQYLILNLAVGGWPGSADPADYPTEYRADWVRVWQQVPIN